MHTFHAAHRSPRCCCPPRPSPTPRSTSPGPSCPPATRRRTVRSRTDRRRPSSSTGHGFTQAVRAIQIIVEVSLAGVQGIPDSWRYDAAGCNAGGFQASYASAGCPSIVGANPRLRQVRVRRVHGQGRRCAFIFDAWTPDPNVDLHAGAVHVRQVERLPRPAQRPTAAGAPRRPECLSFSYATYLDGATNEIPFTSGQEFYLTWNDPDEQQPLPVSGDDLEGTINGTCAPPTTRQRAGSWGSLKASYR